MTLRRLLIWCCLPAVLTPQAEVARNGIANAAAVGVPIAPGSRFLIRGIGLQASRVRIAGKDIPVIRTSATQIEAWLPPSQQPGVYILEVGSAQQNITIARRATGIYPIGQAATRGQQIPLRFTGSAPDQFFVGGVAARVQRIVPRERGISDAYIRIPPAAPEGCAVPVSAANSNFVPLEIGNPCPAPDFLPAIPDGAAGLIALVHNQGARVFDEAWAVFTRRGRSLPIPPAGTCSTAIREIEDQPAGLGADGISAGPWLNVSSGNDRRRVPPVRGAAGVYHAILGGDDGARRPTPLFFNTSKLLIESAGSADVKPIHFALGPPEPALKVTLPNVLSRREGAEIVWDRTAGSVVLAIASRSLSENLRAVCVCVARAEAGRFRIPPAALALLPPGDASEMFLLRLATSMWNRIDGSGLSALYAAGIAIRSQNVNLN